jgi:hypothetical protein
MPELPTGRAEAPFVFLAAALMPSAGIQLLVINALRILTRVLRACVADDRGVADRSLMNRQWG